MSLARATRTPSRNLGRAYPAHRLDRNDPVHLRPVSGVRADGHPVKSAQYRSVFAVAAVLFYMRFLQPRSETILHMHKPGTAVEGRLTSPTGVAHLWRELENGWVDRNPVWDNYIPEYAGDSTGPQITFCNPNSTWKNARLMPTTSRGPTPKTSPMLFNNSFGWNRGESCL